MNEILKENNLKNTKGRELVLETIKKANLPISAEDIYNLVNKRVNLNLSTVYRTLSTLLKKGVLIQQVMHDKKAYYQINNLAHKHILVCQICSSQTPIQDCPMHYLEDKIQNETGFIIKGHNLEILGICANCNKKLNKKNTKKQ